MSKPKIETRLYVDQDLAPGGTLGLDHGRAHFLRSVLRLGRGAQLAVFNGRDGEWRSRIDGFGRGWCSLALEECVRPQTKEADLWLLFAPIKRARLDFLVRKAVELGVSSLRPVFTQRLQKAVGGVLHGVFLSFVHEGVMVAQSPRV